MKRAAIYIRVSTDEQVKHGLSLGEQRNDLMHYAASRGYTVVGIYADEGTSARRKLNQRHELQRLLADVKDGQVDIILIKCLDRWFRNVADYYKVQEILDAHHVTWACSQEDYNTTTTSGRLLLNLKLSIAQNESDQTADRIKYIYEGMKKHGLEVTHFHPYGYRMKDRHLQIVPDERPVIEFVFAQSLAGDSIRTISKKVYDRFHVNFSLRRVWGTLRNRTYIGERYGIAGFCPAIIDRDTFEQVQRGIGFRSQPKRSKYVYLFSGKIICPSCGGILVAHTCYDKRKKSAYKRYFCPRHAANHHMKNDKSCSFGSSIGEASIEKFLLRHLRTLLASYQLEYLDTMDKAAEAEGKVQAFKAKIERLQSLYIDGIVNKEEFQQQYQKLKAQAEQLEGFICRRRKMPKYISRIMDNCDFLKMYLEMKDEMKRELWQTMIERIEILERPKCGHPYDKLRIIFR